MFRKRRHERVNLMADIIIQPGEERPARFAGRVFNLSVNGAAVSSPYHFPAGKLVALELILPVSGVGARRVVLYGVIRRARVLPDGNVLGIEFQTGQQAGDQEWLARALAPGGILAAGRRGFTLTEACITLSIICLLVTMAVPMYIRAMEQARVDAAAGVLRTIWSAQRVYWLEYRAFAPSLTLLEAKDLIDASVAESPGNPSAVFVYQMTDSGQETFTATAMRNGSGLWVGQLSIDEKGDLDGAIQGRGVTITPPS